MIISVIATAVWNKMHVTDLDQFNWFYASLFSRTTDIIHIAATQLSKRVVK
ncbi:hypothetical protein [Candidatus Mycoplasma mahonii]|uniref:hypothetical protein n=1 Tax=Candidatus Mycoplasma mahonii TaxID=3004105 RepID=UPI0026ECE72E|nr:hypothetical protein [Candidatus Mycoplasma mahonii]WKX02744.1 hypothetical protein O3I44_01580 [Candidatus Mycoplasma mahonii]